MRSRVGCMCIASICALASHVSALEKVAVFDPHDGESGWQSGGGSCSIIYYNRCTLWSWAWSGFGDGGRFGVCAVSCCAPQPGLVTSTQVRVFTGAPSGYGFTGTIALQTVDQNCCPAQVLDWQPYIPRGPFDVHSWYTAVPASFAVVVTASGATNPATWGTDHPAPGPTGPQACGFCYPLNRANHSFAWGTEASPVCPGSTFYDGACDAQLRFDIFVVGCVDDVESSSWGSVKALYR